MALYRNELSLRVPLAMLVERARKECKLRFLQCVLALCSRPEPHSRELAVQDHAKCGDPFKMLKSRLASATWGCRARRDAANPIEDPRFDGPASGSPHDVGPNF